MKFRPLLRRVSHWLGNTARLVAVLLSEGCLALVHNALLADLTYPAATTYGSFVRTGWAPENEGSNARKPASLPPKNHPWPRRQTTVSLLGMLAEVEQTLYLPASLLAYADYRLVLAVEEACIHCLLALGWPRLREDAPGGATVPAAGSAKARKKSRCVPVGTSRIFRGKLSGRP